jgi:hypothetical protein
VPVLSVYHDEESAAAKSVHLMTGYEANASAVAATSAVRAPTGPLAPKAAKLLGLATTPSTRE